MSEHRIRRLYQIPERYSYLNREDDTVFIITYSEYAWFEKEHKDFWGKRKRLDGEAPEQEKKELKEAIELCEKLGLEYKSWENDSYSRSYYSVVHKEQVRENRHFSGMTIHIRRNTPDNALHGLYDYAAQKCMEASRKEGAEWLERFMTSPAVSTISDEVNAAALNEVAYSHENGLEKSMLQVEFSEDAVAIKNRNGLVSRIDFEAIGYQKMNHAQICALSSVVADRLRAVLLQDRRVFDSYPIQLIRLFDGDVYKTDDFQFHAVLRETVKKEDKLKAW